jgi:hypothetical protein
MMANDDSTRDIYPSSYMPVNSYSPERVSKDSKRNPLQNGTAMDR